MALDTFDSITRAVLMHCPKADVNLARVWVRNAFRELAERRPWSWLIRRGQFLIPTAYTTGTVSVTRDSNTVNGSGVVWTSAMVGRQFRVGNGPLYTIKDLLSSTCLLLTDNYGGSTESGVTYSIYQAYVTAPNDFLTFVTVTYPSKRWKLLTNIQQAELDRSDPDRENAGDPYLLASRDYTVTRTGTVYNPVQVLGSGPVPTVMTSVAYTGIEDALFVIEVTTSGESGTAEYQWKKNSGSYTTGVVTTTVATTLQEGVQVAWPASVTYIDGDIFVVRTSSQTAPGRPRYELWPHLKTEDVIDYLYVSRPVDVSDSGAAIPYSIPGDTLLEYALSAAARWPGPNVQDRNPYFQINLEKRHTERAERRSLELERQDAEIYEFDSMYENWDWAPVGPIDAKWMQSHV